MQAGLINTYSTLNLGDAAIYAGLAELLSFAQVVASFQDPSPEDVPGVTPVSAVGQRDFYISVGGDIFNNARPRFITKRFLLNLWQLRQDPGCTILFGQSIPRSCQGFSFVWLCRLLSRLAAVCVRDQESYDRLQKAGVNAHLSYDVAFGLSLKQEDITAVQHYLRQKHLEAEELAVLSLRGFDRMYVQDSQQFFSRLVSLTRLLLKRGYQPLILIQAKAYGADHDGEITQALLKEVSGISVFTPFGSTIPAYRLAMGLLGISRLGIGVRYHTSVLRLVSGRVPFNLYYSNKGKDLTERLGIPGCALENFDPEAHMDLIESTANSRFDHTQTRIHVQQTFAKCLERLPLTYQTDPNHPNHLNHLDKETKEIP